MQKKWLLRWKINSSLIICLLCYVQAALAIRSIDIRGFDYSRTQKPQNNEGEQSFPRIARETCITLIKTRKSTLIKQYMLLQFKIDCIY